MAAEKSGAREQNWVITGDLLSKTNGIQNNKINRHKNNLLCAHGNVHKHYNKQSHTKTWGEQRVKYTTSN